MAKLFDNPHAVSVHSGHLMNATTDTAPKDPRGEPYTEAVVRATARAHAFYGWAPNPGSCTGGDPWTPNPGSCTGGDPWTPELNAAYMDEFRACCKMLGRVPLVPHPPESSKREQAMIECHKCRRGVADVHALFKTGTNIVDLGDGVLVDQWTCWGCMTLEQKQHINPLLMDALEEQQ